MSNVTLSLQQMVDELYILESDTRIDIKDCGGEIILSPKNYDMPPESDIKDALIQASYVVITFLDDYSEDEYVYERVSNVFVIDEEDRNYITTH